MNTLKHKITPELIEHMLKDKVVGFNALLIVVLDQDKSLEMLS